MVKLNIIQKIRGKFQVAEKNYISEMKIQMVYTTHTHTNIGHYSLL
jgi:hypothetical protein